MIRESAQTAVIIASIKLERRIDSPE
jgi:hypothetical protein